MKALHVRNRGKAYLLSEGKALHVSRPRTNSRVVDLDRNGFTTMVRTFIVSSTALCCLRSWLECMPIATYHCKVLIVACTERRIFRGKSRSEAKQE